MVNILGNGLDHPQRPGVFSACKTTRDRIPSIADRRDRILSGECTDPKLRVYVTNDTSDVYEDKFTQVACDEAGHIQPTLILLGLRLGIDHVTPVYRDGLRAALQYPQSVGIAGYVATPDETNKY